MKIRNKRDRGCLIAPAGAMSGFEVEPGGVVDVPDDLGRSLLEQSDRWEAVAESKTNDSKPTKGEKE